MLSVICRIMSVSKTNTSCGMPQRQDDGRDWDCRLALPSALLSCVVVKVVLYLQMQASLFAVACCVVCAGGHCIAFFRSHGICRRKTSRHPGVQELFFWHWGHTLWADSTACGPSSIRVGVSVSRRPPWPTWWSWRTSTVAQLRHLRGL